MIAAVGGTYQFISTASANLREKRDPYNEALGGFFAGAILGLRRMFAFDERMLDSGRGADSVI